MEYRRICNVCGKIYCYSDQDISNNKSDSAIAAVSAIGAIAAVFGGGTNLDSYALNYQAERHNDKVIDYNKCPACNSSNTKILTDSEWFKLQQKSDDKNSTMTSKIEVVQPKKRIEINSNATEESLIKRTKLFLEEGDWDSASFYSEQILDINPECAQAYVYKLMIDLKVKKQSDLAFLEDLYTYNNNYKKAIRFADNDLKNTLDGYTNTICERKENKLYLEAMTAFDSVTTEEQCNDLVNKFERIHAYKDSANMISKCKEKALECRYNKAKSIMQHAVSEKMYREAIDLFDSLGKYMDSGMLKKECSIKADEYRKIEEDKRKDEIYNSAISKLESNTVFIVEEAIKEFDKIRGWRDVDQKILECQKRIDEIKKQRKMASIRKYIFIILGIVLIIIVAITVKYAYRYYMSEKYKQACVLYDEGNYDDAYEIFEELVNHENSESKIKEYNYYLAIINIRKGKYEDALSYIYKASGDRVNMYKQYINVLIELDNIETGTNLTQIYYNIKRLGDFENASSLLETNSYMKQIVDLDGSTWRGLSRGAKSANGYEFGYELEISNAIVYREKFLNSPFPSVVWNEEYEIYAYEDYSGSYLYAGDDEEPNSWYSLKVDGNTMDWNNSTLSRIK